MIQVTIFCVLLALPFIIAAQPDAIFGRSKHLTTPSLIRSHGYPFEEHTVTTDDGYILTMHRIPHSPKTGNSSILRPVVFLMHGLLCSSSDWILSGPEKALAYALSDKGFDVWLGNARGNFYSKKHSDPFVPLYWNFTWEQIGIFDLPAMINYVLRYTGQKELRYCGHSQGTTAFFVMSAMKTKLEGTIRSTHLLAPVSYTKHMRSSLAKLAGPLLGQPNAAVEITGSVEFLPKTKEMELLGSLLCSQRSIVKELCTGLIFLLYGWDSPYLDKAMIPDMLATTPAGSSLNQVLHYLQLYNSGEFRRFDYGFLRNKIKYGSWTPPKYNLQNIDVPTFLYYSKNDLLASVTDVERAIAEMNSTSLKGSYLMPQEKWNHIDFLFGTNATEFLYNKILSDMDNS